MGGKMPACESWSPQGRGWRPPGPPCWCEARCPAWTLCELQLPYCTDPFPGASVWSPQSHTEWRDPGLTEGPCRPGQEPLYPV